MITQDDPRLSQIKLGEPADRGFYELISNAWWMCDPITGKPLMWEGRAPQCNSNKLITIGLLKSIYPWATLKQFDKVWLPIKVLDWEYRR